MTKTYVAILPDKIGAFLQANRSLADLGVNITRVSYNKAVDSNTMFLTVEGSEESIAAADKLLAEIGYLQDVTEDFNVVLIEFRVKNEPGSAMPLFELIAGCGLYIQPSDFVDFSFLYR